MCRVVCVEILSVQCRFSIAEAMKPLTNSIATTYRLQNWLISVDVKLVAALYLVFDETAEFH
jgi:hypothetical protein